MIVKTTQAYHKIKQGFNRKGLKFKDNCYLCYTHRVLNQDSTAYESETDYPINKDEDTTIPDEVANSSEFHQLIILGYLEVVSRQLTDSILPSVHEEVT